MYKPWAAFKVQWKLHTFRKQYKLAQLYLVVIQPFTLGEYLALFCSCCAKTFTLSGWFY